MKHAAPILATLTLFAACDSPPAAVAEQAPPARAQRFLALGELQPLAMESTGTGEASTGTTTGVVDAADAPDLGDGSSSTTSEAAEMYPYENCAHPFNDIAAGDAVCAPDGFCLSMERQFGLPLPPAWTAETWPLGLPGLCQIPCDPAAANPCPVGDALALATWPNSIATICVAPEEPFEINGVWDPTDFTCVVDYYYKTGCPEGSSAYPFHNLWFVWAGVKSPLSMEVCVPGTNY